MSNPTALLLASNYKKTVLAASTLASASILPLLDEMEGASFRDFTRELRPAMLEVSSQFSVVAAEAAAAYYDEVRLLFPPTDGGNYSAQMLVSPDMLRDRFRDSIAYNFNGVPTASSYEVVKSNTLMTVQDNVKKSSFSNMVENVKKDKAFVVITYIPSSKACRWCRSIIAQQRVSYRPVDGDAAFGGSGYMNSIYKRGSQFHKRCSCTPMPRFVSSQEAGDYDTGPQNQFNKDFKVATKQAEKLGVSTSSPKDLMNVMDSYQNSYVIKNPGHYWADNPKNPPTFHKSQVWDDIIGPKFGATDKELYQMKQLLAKNNWKPYRIPPKPEVVPEA